MTRKKAIKIIMAVTQNGDRRWANYAFDAAKRFIARNPSNADCCFRVLCYIQNTSIQGGFDIMSFRAFLIARLLRRRYGPILGGTLVDPAGK